MQATSADAKIKRMDVEKADDDDVGAGVSVVETGAVVKTGVAVVLASVVFEE